MSQAGELDPSYSASHRFHVGLGCITLPHTPEDRQALKKFVGSAIQAKIRQYKETKRQLSFEGFQVGKYQSQEMKEFSFVLYPKTLICARAKSTHSKKAQNFVYYTNWNPSSNLRTSKPPTSPT